MSAFLVSSFASRVRRTTTLKRPFPAWDLTESTCKALNSLRMEGTVFTPVAKEFAAAPYEAVSAQAAELGGEVWASEAGESQATSTAEDAASFSSAAGTPKKASPRVPLGLTLELQDSSHLKVVSQTLAASTAESVGSLPSVTAAGMPLASVSEKHWDYITRSGNWLPKGAALTREFRKHLFADGFVRCPVDQCNTKLKGMNLMAHLRRCRFGCLSKMEKKRADQARMLAKVSGAYSRALRSGKPWPIDVIMASFEGHFQKLETKEALKTAQSTLDVRAMPITEDKSRSEQVSSGRSGTNFRSSTHQTNQPPAFFGTLIEEEDDTLFPSMFPPLPLIQSSGIIQGEDSGDELD